MKLLKIIIEFTADFIKRVSRDRISVFAAQASFFILISSIPFLMLLLGFAKYIIPFSKSEILNVMSHFLPGEIYHFTADIINELFTRTPVSFLSVTALTLLWSASRGILSIIQGLNAVWGNDGYGFFRERIHAFFYTLLFLLTLIFALILLLLGKALMNVLAFNLYVPFLLVLLILTLSVFYTYLPEEKVSFKYQLPGAAFTGVIWFVFTWLYSLYIDNFSNFSYVYGSLAAIVLLMLWLYICTTLFLYGAELNRILTEKITKK